MTLGQISDAQAQRFRRLAWPLLPVVLRTAQCLTRREDLAEDLAQDTMIKAMRAIDTYQDGTNIKAWLLTILRRTNIDRLRARQNQPSHLPLDAVGEDWPAPHSAEPGRHDPQWKDPQEIMGRFEDRSIIDVLGQLPQDIRWTLLLVDVEQMPHADAAAVLDVPVGTIKSRVHRGRAMLRDHLYDIALKRGWISKGEGTS